VRETIAGQVGNADLEKGGVSGMSRRDRRPIVVPGESADQAESDDASVWLRRAGSSPARAGEGVEAV